MNETEKRCSGSVIRLNKHSLKSFTFFRLYNFESKSKQMGKCIILKLGECDDSNV